MEKGTDKIVAEGGRIIKMYYYANKELYIIIIIIINNGFYSIYQYFMSISSFFNTVSVSRYSRPITVTRDPD
jgi:hypothetical protein